MNLRHELSPHEKLMAGADSTTGGKCWREFAIVGSGRITARSRPLLAARGKISSWMGIIGGKRA
jgi:hypothetical protein